MFSRLGAPLVLIFILTILRTSAAELTNAEVYTAIRNNDLTALRGLANVEVADDRGRTPLMLAASTGSLDGIKTLLTAGANVNASDAFGVTPLMYGVRDIARVRLLLDAGAHVEAKTQQGQTPLLIAAAIQGSLETVQLLVAKGADPKAVGAAGRTGLIAAADANDLAMVEFFLGRGVNVNATARTDRAGHTALMAAASQPNTAMVKLLLQHGADPNMATDTAGVGGRNGPLALKGQTALMIGATYGSPELIRALISARATVNVSDVRGMTPLMHAVATDNQDPEVVKLLLAAGADVDAKSVGGETALDWARKYGRPSVLKLLGGEAGTQPPASKRFDTVAIPSNADLRAMIQASTAFVQQADKQFSAKGGCVSCHLYIAFTTVTAVREKGIQVDEAAAATERQSIITSLRGRENSGVQRTDGPGSIDGVLYSALALRADKYPADFSTDAMVAYLMSKQLTDGRWAREIFTRVPLSDGAFLRAANAVSLMQTYAPPALKAEVDEHIGRARKWFMSAQPKTTDDRAMLVLGLQRSGAPQPNVRASTKALLDVQRADGGWGGNADLESDAYSTSHVLRTLLDAGTIATGDAPYQRGVQFLITTRAADGTWHVRSRSPKFQPYFEGGFPYGHDQWISGAATARAVEVLARYAQ